MSKKFPNFKFRIEINQFGEIGLSEGKWYSRAEIDSINAKTTIFNRRLERKKEILEARREKIDKQINNLPQPRYDVQGTYDFDHQTNTFDAHPNIDAIRHYENTIQYHTTDGRILYNAEES